MANIAIIGAGIAGLTAAHRLKAAGHRPVVFERSNYAGGRIKSFQRGGYTFDIGAFIYLGSYDDAVELINEIGLAKKLGRFDAYGAMPRNAILNFLNFNTPLRTILQSNYISGGSKLKMLKLFILLFKHWKDLNYRDASGIAEIDNDTVVTYCERELNREILDYVASVVVRGPWLTDPATASIGQLLWTLKNFFKPYFYGLEGGMDILPRALAEALEVRLSCPVANIADHGSHVEVTWRQDDREQREHFERCIITTTTDQALALFPQMNGEQRHFYESTKYITSVNTHLALSKRPSNPATYIMVAPRENPDLCGVIVDHLKAQGRVPDGKGMITVFCRHEWCVKNLDASDNTILDQVLRFVQPYYGELGPIVTDYEIGRWPQVVPMMPQGRFKAITAYEKSINPADKVQFAGDLVPIGGVNAALVSGRSAAERVKAQYA